MIQIGDKVINIYSGVIGRVYYKYYPNSLGEFLLVRTNTGRTYYGPTSTFIKIDEEKGE